MRRLTIYLTEELHEAICAHAAVAGQKLSTFISRELAHLVLDPAVDTAAPLRRQAATAAKRALPAVRRRA